MEEIKVNEYVRTKEGYIARFIHYGINEGINGKSCLFDKAIRDISCLIYDEDNFLFDSELKKYIVKHSPNIIDLIEEEDIAVLNCYGFKVKKIVKQDDILELKLGNYELLEILTKEQYNQMKYIVGGE